MSVFTTQAAAAVSTLHAVFGEAATYTAAPAAPVHCTAILSYRDEAVGMAGFTTQVRAPGWEARLAQSDITTRPPRGATITITATGAVLTVQDVQEDAERSEWLCDVA